MHQNRIACAGKKISDYWESSKRLLNDANKFLDSLLTFEKDNIPDAIIKRIEPYIQMEDFTPEAVAKVSKACTSICMWVRAMHLYHTVSLGVSELGRQLQQMRVHKQPCVWRDSGRHYNKACQRLRHLSQTCSCMYVTGCHCAGGMQVAPKRAALAAAQESLDRTLAELSGAQARLAAVQEKIATLESQYAEATNKKATLAAQVKIMPHGTGLEDNMQHRTWAAQASWWTSLLPCHMAWTARCCPCAVSWLLDLFSHSLSKCLAAVRLSGV